MRFLEIIGIFFLKLLEFFSSTNQIRSGSFSFVADNINKNMTRRHHTVKIANKQFNGTMRSAFHILITPQEITKMAQLQKEKIEIFHLYPDEEVMTRFASGMTVQLKEMATELRNEKREKRSSDMVANHWLPLEITDQDSKYTSEMIKILDDLIKECNLQVESV